MAASRHGRAERADHVRGHRWFAALYDTISRPTERGAIGRERARLIRPLTGRVLEIGIGTGTNLPHYAAGAQVVGIEPDPYMLRRARNRLAGIGSTHIALQQAEAEALPFADGCFDHVVSTLVLCTVRDPMRALSEMRRVLRPGGMLHFVEHVRADGAAGRLQDFVRPLWKYFGAGCTVNRRTGELLEPSGFRIERLSTMRMEALIPVIAGSARRA